jgi:phosphotransferase family enzyme
MTSVQLPVAPTDWRHVVPAGRRYVMLPNASNPVVVCDSSRAVLDYTRRALLAAPPGARVPAIAFEAARRLLGQPGMWRLAPTSSLPPTAATDLSGRLAAAGYRAALLDHSHDPDKRLIALLFQPGADQPSHAIKVASDRAGAARLRAERDRLRNLQRVDVDAVLRCAPRLVELRGLDGDESSDAAQLGEPDAGELLATTAARGTPMFVVYHRGRHTRRRQDVRADFTAAASWLAELQEHPTGPDRKLDLAAEIEHARPADTDDGEAFRIRRALSALRQRLRRYRAADRVVHGDFWPGNLLVENGTISGVIDWERWSPAGSPVRDLARFAATYSLYLDRRTRPGHRVPGHRNLQAGSPGGGIGYALDGTGWYPQLVRDYLQTGLRRLGLPVDIGRDVVLAEVAANAAESTSPEFAADLWQVFLSLSQVEP